MFPLMFPYRLSPGDIRHIRSNVHAVCTMRKLNISEVDRLVAALLLVDDRPYSVSALSNTTGYSRKTVRAALERGMQADHTSREPQGWVLTDGGRLFITALFKEGLEMIEGRRSWYSEELLRLLPEVPPEGNRWRVLLDDDHDG